MARTRRLKGKRVVLRSVRESDFAMIHKWWNDPRIHKYFDLHPFPVTITYVRAWYGDIDRWYSESFLDDTNYAFVIEVEDQRAIGIADLYCIRRQHKTGNIGLMIGESEYWGKGYGTESTRLLLDFAFDKLGLNKVCMATVEYNERLIRSAKKCGFVVEGRKRQQRMHGVYYHDEIDMGVLETEYRELRQQCSS